MKLIVFYFDYKADRMFKDVVNSEGKTEKMLSSASNFVYKNDTLAKIIEVADQSEIKAQIDPDEEHFHVVKFSTVKPGDGVFFDQLDQKYKSMEYGFVRYDRGTSKITVFEPLQIPRDKTKAIFLIHPTKSGKMPTFDDISGVLVKRNIHSMVSRDELEKQLSDINPELPALHRIIVAKGKEPVNGYKEYYVPLIDLEKKAGKILEDGSIDYREIDSIIHIKERQAVLQKIPAKESEDGYTIFGDTIPALTESRKGVFKGKNIVVSNDESIYVSAIDGCVTIAKNVVSVLPVAIVHGDVDYETGNIDFNGSVEITGSVLPGFTVKAKDNIIVKDNVDDAVLEAGGDIIVHSGIAGKGAAKIYAEGSVQAKYIINSLIEAKGEVSANVFIINSRVYTNENISIKSKNGKIIGGECMALKKISTYISGGPKENKTVLTAGKSRLVERELNNLKIEAQNCEMEVDELKEYIKTMYGEEIFNNTKEFLTILPEVKRKNCVMLLTKLAKINEKLKESGEKYEAAVEKYKPEHEPEIIVYNEVFPGTVINIKRRTKNIERKYSNVKFFEDNEEKVIKFTYAI